MENYATLADVLGSPVFFDLDQAYKGQSDTCVMLRNENARQTLMMLRSLPLELASIRNSCLEGLDGCHWSMKKLHQLDSAVPDFEGVFTKGLIAGPGLLRALNQKDLTDSDKQAFVELGFEIGAKIISSIIDEYNASQERDSYKTAYARTRSEAVRSIRNVAGNQYKGTEKAARKALEIKFNGSWNNTFIFDTLSLRNDTGKDLTHATLLVDLFGYHALSGEKESDAHLHYIAKWPSGTWIYLPYPSKCKNGMATNQSADSVESMRVILFADQCWDRIDNTYIGEDYDSDVKRYFETQLNPTFTAAWRVYRNDNLLWNTIVKV